MKVCIIGQGYVGLPLAIQAANAGYEVLGFDIDTIKIQKLKKGITSSPEVNSEDILKLQAKGRLTFLDTLKTNLKISIFIIAVPTPLNKYHEPDLDFLKLACEEIAKYIEPGALVINESTSFIGTLRNFIKPIIELGSGIKDLKYAVAPERIDPGNIYWDVKSTPRVISGLGEIAISEAIKFYSTFCNSIYRVEKPEIAETSKLLENTFRQVNIALINEISEITGKFGFSIHEAINAAATKPFGFMAFYPSIGVGGHCIPVDPSYLNYSAGTVGLKSKFIELANDLNLKMPAHVVSRIESELGFDFNEKKVQIVGIAYKSGVSDLRESPALELIKFLQLKGAHVSYHDPLIMTYHNLNSEPLRSDIDLGLIVTPHKQIDFLPWEKCNFQVLDLSPSPVNLGWTKFL